MHDIFNFMSVFEIILLAIALAMDCLTVSIVAGVLGTTRRNSWRMAFLFGLFQALMPLIGWLGISQFNDFIKAVDHWIAFGLLAFIGGRMIKESFDSEEEKHFDANRLGTQLLLAIATSIDALAIGITFACTGYENISQLTLPLIIIGVVSLLFSLIGYHTGSRFGRVITRKIKPELIGGIILIIIGVKILLTHLFEL